MTEFFGEPISTYTSEQATADGVLFDLDLIKKYWHREGVPPSPLKFVTRNLLSKGYWSYCTQSRVPRGQEGKDDRCVSCKVFIESHGKPKLPCLEQTLNIPNMIDLISQSLRIFSKKIKDDWFVSGMIELPSGSKQQIFIAQNETGRYTVMLPEDY